MSDESDVEFPRLSKFQRGATVTVNGGQHEVTDTWREDGFAVVEFGEFGVDTSLQLRYQRARDRGLLVRLKDDNVVAEHPVEQFALGAVDIYGDRQALKP